MSAKPHPDWIVPSWPAGAPANLRAFVTTRAGGVSVAPFDSCNLSLRVGDDPLAVAENRARLRTSLPSAPHWLQLVHGVEVYEASAPAADTSPDELPVADASVTRAANAVLTVSIADCLPVLFCDASGSVVAAAHAGWRGLCAGVLERTVERMRVAPASLYAWLGPCIGPTAFEVGEDVRSAFCAAQADAAQHFKPHPQNAGKWLCDLAGLAGQRLRAAGVQHVATSDLCTVSDPRFYSFRRDRVTGRMHAFIWFEK